MPSIFHGPEEQDPPQEQESDEADGNAVSLQVIDGQPAAESEEDNKQISFADVGGLEYIKRDTERRIIAPFKQSGLLLRLRKISGGGVLMCGPPGCGKTIIARAAAGE